jgi:hypothetical protein
MFIAAALDEEIEQLKESLSAFEGEAELDVVAELLERSATGFARVGLGALLVDADVERLERNLAFSGFARRWYLVHLSNQEVDDRHRAMSRWPSFLATMAGNHLELARELARLDSTSPVPSGEYPDDFATVRAIADLLLGKAITKLLPLIEESNPELVVLLDALAGGVVAEFDIAFEALMVSETERILQAPDSDEPLDDELSKRISLLGLALLNLARARGLTPAVLQHDRLPSLAQRLPGVPPDDLVSKVRAQV